jgi:hypothetical protein
MAQVGSLATHHRRGNRLIAVLIALLAFPRGAKAVEKASQQVSPFYGSFGYSIPIEVPPFHGLEPRLALSYSSEGRNGIVGVGWSLNGFSTIERANSGRGTPRFDANDIYLLDGQELVKCVGGSVSPSCTSGGTHSTKIESYLKIRHDTTPSDTWTVWGKDGTRTIFTPIIQLPAGIFRWGQTSVVDTKNNTVTYTWSCPVGEDCYPDGIAYNGYAVTFFRETVVRPDPQTAAAYSQLTQMKYRIRSIFVWLPGVGHIRAYELSYATSPLTGRSRLASVKQYGKNVTHDGQGLITGGTALPPVTFTYQNDAAPNGGKIFVGEAPNPPTSGTENVVWANRINAYAVAPGNSLGKSIGSNAWDAGGSSTRALASGDGYLEVTATGTGEKVVGLSNGDTGASSTEIDFGVYESFGSLYVFENTSVYGPLGTVANGDILRIEVQGNVVRYKKNGGAPFRTSNVTPTYPLLVDASIHTANGVITNAVLSGSLGDANYWCQGASLLTGDFNTDGRTDQLCIRTIQSGTTTLQVALATATGFGPPTTWLAGTGVGNPVIGDFNADGKADIADGPDWDGNFYVSLSTGSAFGAFALWGSASPAYGVDGEGHPLYGACKAAGTTPGTGDFNGDGITDVSCREAGDPNMYIGLSNGVNGFAFSIFGNFGCDTYEQTGAIDFDGDGKDDWFCIGMTNHQMLVFPSTGSTFVYPAFGSLPGTFCDQPYYVLGDFNGDGRTDASCMQSSYVALSTGHSFIIQSGTYATWCAGSTNFFAADVDGDGASEIVCNLPSSGDVHVRKWNAGALNPAETWKQGWCRDFPSNAARLSGGNFDGDGKTDLLCNAQATPVALAGTGGFQADLVSSIANGLGATITASYSAATNYPETNVTKQVVASVGTNDGRTGSQTATTTYSYSGGKMEPKERRFLGFRTVRETPPCLSGESPCPYTETLLHQDLPRAGKVEKVERRAGTSYLSKQEYTWVPSAAGVFPATSLLTEEKHYSYDSTGASRNTKTTHLYDAYGNRTRTDFHGETTPLGDETTVAWTFSYNTSSYIVDRVATQRQFAGVGTGGEKLAERLFYYDNANSETVVPSQGYVTAALGWLKEESRHVRRNFGYDSYGNLTSVTDEENRPPTTTTYDPARHIFPETVTNGANEAETTLWDPICGIPSQRTDANNQVTTTQADDLCRLTRTDHLSTGGFEIRSYVSIGNPNTQHARVEVRGPGTNPNLYTST